jgi:hypothetical protein
MLNGSNLAHREGVDRTPTTDRVTDLNTQAGVTIQTRHAGRLGGARSGAGRPVKRREGPSETPEELAADWERFAAHEAGMPARRRL